MRRPFALFLLLATIGVVGCSGAPVLQPTAWLNRFRSAHTLSGPDVVQLDVALIEVPITNDRVNNELWSFIDEAVPLEKKFMLQESGFRVGQVNASASAELQELLTSKRTCREPRRMQTTAGKGERALEVGPQRARCQFRMPGDEPRVVDLEQALCSLVVQPSLASENQTRLKIVPQIKHAGADKTPWMPKADRSGWTMQFQNTPETYPASSWEVTLKPNEFLVIGARSDRPGTMGHEFFVRTDEPAPVQRLLVVRATRSAPAADAATAPAVSRGKTVAPPIAAQASMSVRGVSP